MSSWSPGGCTWTLNILLRYGMGSLRVQVPKLGPPARCPSLPFFGWEGSPTKIGYRKKGTWAWVAQTYVGEFPFSWEFRSQVVAYCSSHIMQGGGGFKIPQLHTDDFGLGVMPRLWCIHSTPRNPRGPSRLKNRHISSSISHSLRRAELHARRPRAAGGRGRLGDPLGRRFWN